MSLLAVIMRTGLMLGAVVCVPSVIMAMRAGLTGVIVIDVLAIAVLAALIVLKQLPFTVRATVFCLILYALGTGLLIWVGARSQIFLLGFSILTALLLGTRAGLASVVLSTVTLFLVGLWGSAAPEMLMTPQSQGVGFWFTVTLNFALIASLLVLAIGVVISAMEAALRQEILARSSFEQQRTVLRTLIDAMPDVVFTKDLYGRFELANRAACEQFSKESEAQLIGLTARDIFPTEYAAQRESEDARVFAGEPLLNAEAFRIRPDGTVRWFLVIKVPLRNALGEITGLIGISRDITDRKLAEVQRDQLQQELQQSQKMEAVGQLAGGIAHDFNNLLTIITGHSGLLLTSPDISPDVQESVEEIGNAADRAAALTRQLLAFSRQALTQPEVLDVNAVVLDTSKLLRRLIGEDISLSTTLDSQVAAVRADPSQLNQILMNLALNARDAMPTGGTLSIETGNVEIDHTFSAMHLSAAPGLYVMLRLSDSGSGMEPGVLSRIFEPFYTTKGVGKGTGLGLSMVFGIVQQSGGGIHVHSEPGHGSTFRIYLPAVPVSTPTVIEETGGRTPGGTETILLVEDDSGVRALALRALQGLGYDVLTANDGLEALEVATSTDKRIALLVTDVVMPNLSGPALVERLRTRLPHVAVLYVSGYTDDAVLRHGLLQAEVDFLQKPFTASALARKVRTVLDEHASGSAAR
ncbi:ATP-binding protein [Gemmatimonas groenlandica]|uniref:histidine kinase n=1 Tax=Gemmatimonas groenlandica TaxID=2732249 RepID=A0A6M4IUJ7_9BACT|nr:ATP-binding protein [Gemmatimonas groenlandica]QJR35821.1 PAS domain-containing protein [Gemmatimonas groenlandica]